MLRTILTVFLITFIAAAALLAVRYLLVEPDEVAAACVAQAATFSCKIRNAAIFGFSRHLFGPISIVAAILAMVGAMRIFAIIAIVAGMAGVVLFDFDIAGFGLLLGAVVFVHLGLNPKSALSTGQDGPAQ